MLDIKYVRENLAEVKKKIATKCQFKCEVDKVLKLDEEKRVLMGRVEMLRAEANKVSKQKGRRPDAVHRIGLCPEEGSAPEGDIARAKEIKKMLKDLEPQLAEAEENFKVEAVKLPNLPLDDVPVGKSPSENEVIKKEGKITLEKGKDHIEIGKVLDIIDIERASKVSGSRFYYLKNQAAELEFALVQYALDIVKKEGFKPIIPPDIIKLDAAWGSGHLEAINDDAYHIKGEDSVLVGTSEQSILPLHMNETLTDLPLRYVAFSTCFRREAGSYGKDVRGILRVHQFDKLEMFTFCRPEDSQKEHDIIVNLEERIVSGLGLPYQVVKLSTGDIGLPSAKTIDIETWMPGEGKYRETHSSSNCTDFQARRLNIRYKSDEGNKFVHTLNGTGVAIGRMLIAILENYQQKDGSVKVPEVLHKYLDFKEIMNMRR
ncbi:MAG: serS [Candidatus Berkelbacteria bacterium]|nr:serS [Candidatus Berkelbacteria bacterium]